MPPGSYWTQPKGGVHITSAKGADTVAFIEIDDGPYLVRPVEAAFGSEEEIINTDVADLPWVDATSWSSTPGAAGPCGAPMPCVAPLWGAAGGSDPGAVLLKLAPGSGDEVAPTAGMFRVVTVAGRTMTAGADGEVALDPGSLVTSGSAVALACADGAECLLYLRTEGSVELSFRQ